MHMNVRVDIEIAKHMLDLMESYEEGLGLNTETVMADLRKIKRAGDLIEQATVLHDDPNMTIFEHPIKGDTAPMMAYHKDSKRFFENCDFWDCGNPEEILEGIEMAVAQEKRLEDMVF